MKKRMIKINTDRNYKMIQRDYQVNDINNNLCDLKLFVSNESVGIGDSVVNMTVIDTDNKKIQAINKGKRYILHKNNNIRLSGSSDHIVIGGCDFFIGNPH